MIFAYAEIITLDGNAGLAHDYADAVRKLSQAWRETGTWAVAIAAGNADEPMKVVASIDANGTIWEPGCEPCSDCGHAHGKSDCPAVL